jgi:hypothetical protein
MTTRIGVMDAGDPLLSVVVTVIEGGVALERTLAALDAQEAPPPLEVLVPYDETVAGIGELAVRFPAARFLALGRVITEHPPSSAAGQHELFDRRRAAGVREARGQLVAIVEDRGTPRADWARTAVRLHTTLAHAVIGGAVDPLAPRLLEFAAHVCDFGRYTPPFDDGPRAWVSDVNVVYKRAALEQTRALWAERYHEPVVHWALQHAGETLYLSNALVVRHQRTPMAVTALLRERFHWGRLFGVIRGRSMPLVRRLAFGLASPIIPPMLYARHVGALAGKGRLVRVLAATPALLLLLVTWTAGEAAGVLTRRT